MSSPLSLLEAFALVPDPRSPHGRIHPLVSVLGLTVVALLAGCRSLDAIAQFGRDRGLPLAVALGFRRAKTPNKSALSKLFRRLDVNALETVLRTWLEGRGATDGHLALDGKALTGSRDGHVPGQHLVAVYAVEHAAVVGQLRMARSTNEHKTALRLLGVLPLAGRVVTADAMFTHRDVCYTIVHAGGDYVLAVKDNQPTLQADLEAEFAEEANFPPSHPRHGERQTDRTRNKGHGRIERRVVVTSTALNQYLWDWPKLAQVTGLPPRGRCGCRVRRLCRFGSGRDVKFMGCQIGRACSRRRGRHHAGCVRSGCASVVAQRAGFSSYTGCETPHHPSYRPRRARRAGQPTSSGTG